MGSVLFLLIDCKSTIISKKKKKKRLNKNKQTKPPGFPGSPVVQTLHFHCSGLGFDPWSGK